MESSSYSWLFVIYTTLKIGKIKSCQLLLSPPPSHLSKLGLDFFFVGMVEILFRKRKREQNFAKNISLLTIQTSKSRDQEPTLYLPQLNEREINWWKRFWSASSVQSSRCFSNTVSKALGYLPGEKKMQHFPQSITEKHVFTREIKANTSKLNAHSSELAILSSFAKVMNNPCYDQHRWTM